MYVCIYVSSVCNWRAFSGGFMAVLCDVEGGRELDCEQMEIGRAVIERLRGFVSLVVKVQLSRYLVYQCMR